MNRQTPTAGFSLPELLVTTAVLGVLSTVALVHAGPDRSRQQLDQAAQGLRLAIDRARLVTQRDQQACGLELMPELGGAESDLQPCPTVAPPLASHGLASGIEAHTNLPPRLRFSINGLLLDGGLVVFSKQGTGHRPCVVASLPLGVIRQGTYGADPAQELNSRSCLPRS